MRRELDLLRQLLLDIESRGPDCSVSLPGTNHDNQERIRYHLRLLIDAGLVKEIDRTTAGVPCVRLTHDGHELLELVRDENLWREAKALCQERTGGLSLTVVRTLLVYSATGQGSFARNRRGYEVRRRRLETEVGRLDSPRYLERPHYLERSDERDHEGRYVRVRPQLAEYADRPTRYLADWEEEPRLSGGFETHFPTQLI